MDRRQQQQQRVISNAPSGATRDLSCTERLDRARAYVLLMRDLREVTWRESNARPIQAR
jgi:hypothetical protein